MRASTGIALVAAALLVGVVIAFTIAPRPPEPAPAGPPAVQLVPGEPLRAPADQQRVLDELEDDEAEEYGKAEAHRRRNYREQLLEQRPAPADP